MATRGSKDGASSPAQVEPGGLDGGRFAFGEQRVGFGERGLKAVRAAWQARFHREPPEAADDAV